MPRTSSWRQLTAVATLSLTVLAGCSSPATAPPPADVSNTGGPGGLVAKTAAVDLGRVPFDKQIDARFDLTNTGSKPIKLAGKPQVQMLEGC